MDHRNKTDEHDQTIFRCSFAFLAREVALVLNMLLELDSRHLTLTDLVHL